MTKLLFSQRNGYVSVENLLVREKVTRELKNAICNCYDVFRENLSRSSSIQADIYQEMEMYLWRYFLNEKISDFSDGYHYKVVFQRVIDDDRYDWYRKLDVIESSLSYLYSLKDRYYFNALQYFVEQLVDSLNNEFKRLHFAYRIIDTQIVEVASEEEIAAIQQAIDDNRDGVREHINKAIELCSKRPLGDYRNSIKESISAVEVLCRKLTGEGTLGKALSKLQKKGIVIPQMLQSAFEKLYAYTNNEGTGIRHALMDDEGTYTPGSEEALFMLVSCSAFINYLNTK